jgi:hypothetical protein
MRYRLARTMTVAALVAGMSIASMPTALARIVDRERWSFADSYTDELCGIDVQIDEAASGLFMIRSGRPGSTAFLASNIFEYREVITNQDTGDWLVVRGQGNFREVKATHVEGDVYRFRAQTAGQHFVVEDQSGKVVYRERGLLVFEILFDTLGDDEPGGVEESFELVEVRGHPGLFDGDQLCDLALDLIG